MIIDKNIAKYSVFSEDTLRNALRKINDNKERVVFAVGETGRLDGVVTDGDVRRWLVGTERPDLDVRVGTIANRDFLSVRIGEDRHKIEAMLSDRIAFVPLLDGYGHLVGVARARRPVIDIAGFRLEEHSPAFVIAEIGNNHQGSLDLACRLIDEAAAAGADCAKFQLRDMASLYRNSGDHTDASEDLGSQYTLDLLSRFSLGVDDLFRAFDYAKTRNLVPLCTPWDPESVAALERYGVAAYKAASADLTNHQLLTAIAETGRPLMLSTGMSHESEIIEAVEVLKRQGAQYVLLHCNSTYPAPFKDINLSYMDRLRAIGDCLVGYSGHERGFAVVLAAVARGAKVVEKHFTLDKTQEGNDHKVSLLPDEFRAMVDGIRQIEDSMGSTDARALTQGEMMNRETLAKSLIVACDIEAGQEIADDMLLVRSPGKGLQPNQRAALVGRKSKRAMKAGDFFFPSDISDSDARPRPFSYRRPWGLPVRYHDYRSLLAMTNMPLVEFHLSYVDMDAALEPFFDQPLDVDFVIHSPELFAGDHVLDLCSLDEAYRAQSIRSLQRVIDLTRTLKRWFPRTQRPMIVTNVGGFSMDAHLSAAQIAHLHTILDDSLSKLDMTGVEIIPQTMPPYPWHFGGQRYHNLFVDAADIAGFCQRHDMRVCLDVSHSKLACTHLKTTFTSFMEEVGPHVAHLHLADAKGVDGEGIQIGTGDLDFAALAAQLDRLSPKASFIPEIWQGHKNDGEGFWVALDRLEAWF
ncbi:Sialic acid synthase [Candidatus Terasakiella magnetica]|nr:Sialic acid synthase [Candidatus Terasakiella magnetica]